MRELWAYRNFFGGQEDAPFCFSFENPHLKVNKKIISSSKFKFFVIEMNALSSLYKYDWLW